MTDRLDRFRPPEPPPELRARALAAARRQLAGEPRTETWIDRWWESRGLRRAWLLATVVLLALRLGPGAAEEDAASPTVVELHPPGEVEQMVWRFARLHRERAARIVSGRGPTWSQLAYLEELDR